MTRRWRLGTTRIDGIVVDACWSPAEGGRTGDFHAVTDLPDGRVAVLVGDVAGHGPTASAIADRIVATAKTALRDDVDFGRLLAELDVLTHRIDSDLIVTFVCALVEPDRGSVLLLNAGHLPPVKATENRPSLLDGTLNPPLGISISRTPIATGLGPTDTLFVVTDGLIERRGRSLGDAIDALLDVCSAISPTTSSPIELADALTRLFGPPTDDATVVSIRVTPAATR